MSFLVDIGANLTSSKFKKSELDDILNRAYDNDLSTVIITGTDIKNSIEALNMCMNTKSKILLKSTFGIHPHDAKEFNDKSLKIIEDNVMKFRNIIVAIGETGLDFNRNFSPKEAQINSFREHLNLAKRLNIPVFCHERDAHDDFIKLVEDSKIDASLIIVHCFSGTKDELTEYVKKGYYIGITGFICGNRGADLRNFVNIIPKERLLIETDAPFMLYGDKSDNFIKSLKGRNEPCFVKYVCDTLSKCYGVDYEVIAGCTSKNSNRLFKLFEEKKEEEVKHEEKEEKKEDIKSWKSIVGK
jgi:TatD DNase family protein